MGFLKKHNTYFIMYHMAGDTTNKYSFYVTSLVNISDIDNSANSFRDYFRDRCIEDQKENYNKVVVRDQTRIESIQLLNTTYRLIRFWDLF